MRSLALGIACAFAGLAVFGALNWIAAVACAAAFCGYVLTDGDDDLP